MGKESIAVLCLSTVKSKERKRKKEKERIKEKRKNAGKEPRS